MVEYGTTHFCTADKLEATKDIGNRAQGTGCIYNEAVSDHTGQCERRAGVRDRQAVRLFRRDRPHYD